MRWPEATIAELAKGFISGGTPSTRVERYWKGDIPWVTGADVTDKVVMSGRDWITKEAVEQSATNVVPKGAVLLVTRTGVGKVARAGADIAISQDLTGVILKDGIDADFVVAAILSKIGDLLHIQQGAIIKGVLRKDVEKMRIPVPALSEQRRIVEMLNLADTLRKKRAFADEKAVHILPALFNKMFGDPLELAYLDNAVPLGQMDVSLQNGFACGEKEVEGGIPHLRMNNIDDAGVLNLDLVRTVPVDRDEERYRLSDGDVLFMGTNSEEKIGKTCFFQSPDDRHYLFSNHLIRMRVRDSRLTPEYLGAFLHLLWTKRFYLSIAKRWVNQASVSLDALAAVRIPVPHKAGLRDFSGAFHEILALRSRRAQAHDLLDSALQSLRRRAFSGELTAKWRERHAQQLLREMEGQARLLNSDSCGGKEAPNVAQRT